MNLVLVSNIVRGKAKTSLGGSDKRQGVRNKSSLGKLVVDFVRNWGLEHVRLVVGAVIVWEKKICL